MKTMQIEVSDRLAREIESLVEKGWFANETEVAHLALSSFIQGYRFELMEQFQREDITWALKQKQADR